jgi:hypothetical protein
VPVGPDGPFELDEQASLLSFNWTEKSTGMTDDDY